MGSEQNHASISAGHTQKPGHLQGLLSLSLSIVAAPPPPTDAHPCNTHTHSQVHVHTQQFLARGVISLSLSLCPIQTLLQLTFHIPDN